MARTKRKTAWATTSHAHRAFLKEGIDVRIGPGGWDCNCCAPPRGKRDHLFRSIRRKMRQNLRSE